MAVALVANAFLAAAMVRAVLRPLDDRFGYLRLGADELRQLGLFCLALLVMLGVYIGVILVTVVVGVLLVAAKAAPASVAVVAIALWLFALVFVGIRLSLAPALTFDTRRINLFGSWAMTRGRFWSLLGAYLLAFALVLVVYLLSFMLIFAVGALLNGGDPLGGMWKTDMTSLTAYFAPARLIETALSAGVSALVYPVLFTPPVAIYRALSPASDARPA
jgi:hypothetical protein